jgi:hypothetical protein
MNENIYKLLNKEDTQHLFRKCFVDFWNYVFYITCDVKPSSLSGMCF